MPPTPLLLQKLLEKHEALIFAYLFGSHARQAGTPMSDVDIAVYLDMTTCPLEERLSLVGDLTRALQTEEVDVVVLNTAPLSLVGRILTHRVVLLDRNPNLRHRYESLLLRQFHDFSIKERSILERRFGLG
jgi:predicted nucleotidyltransferase